MKQCLLCFRFVVPGSVVCPLCGSQKLNSMILACGEDFSNYVIFLKEIWLDGETYVIERLINRGGSSTILEVADILGNHYALKVPFVFDTHFTTHKGNSDRDVVNSLKYIQSEIANLKRLPPGHFLKVHATGTAAIPGKKGGPSFPYILMELANTTVKHLIQAEMRGTLDIPLAEKKQIILDFIHSVRSLHEVSVVHRDLSPDNVFCVNRDGRIRYILSDFGTSKHREDIGSSMSSQIFSHDFYLDPERVTNRRFRYDERSDIWSAGAIISEIIAGNFWVNIIQNPLCMDVKVLDFIGDILAPVIKNKVDAELYRILCKTVQRDPVKRYQKISQLAEDLEKFFSHASVERFCRLALPSMIYLNVFLSISLPWDSGNVIPQRDVAFDGLVNLEFNALADTRILFPGFIVEQASLTGTRLFEVTTNGGGVDLFFRQDYFFKRFGRYRRMLAESEGQLKVYFQLCVKYRHP